MPELPEVENIARGLRREVVGLVVKGVSVNEPRIIREGGCKWRKDIEKYIGHRIIAILRRGKRLIIVMDNKRAMLVQLGMTGQVLIKNSSEPTKKHTHFVVKFPGNKELWFVDPRRFGRLCLLENVDIDNPDAAMEEAGFARLGPEATGITREEFRQTLVSKRVIKTLLLDQIRIAGLGNIYVDEALFAAGVNPLVVADMLSDETADLLRREIRKILRRAIANGGTTFSDFRDTAGEKGRFSKMLRVYQRTGEPCRICGRAIERMVIGGRSSHFCPKCQTMKG